MKAYLATLNQFTEQVAVRDAAEKEARALEKAAAARDRFVSLDERLKRVLATIPVEVQREGLSLMALQTQLRARGQGHMHCHVGELGAALRRLGFVRKRDWGKQAGEFRALWFPHAGQ